MKKIHWTFLFYLLIIFLIGACSNESSEGNINEAESEENEKTKSETLKDEETLTIDLEASKKNWQLNEELSMEGWLYNGTLPGKEIRVKEGDRVNIQFTNSLDVPTAVHFHGIPIPNDMDGVPGITQNVIMPGENFTYEINAEVPGTYWYHSHQDGATQVVDKGLYGAFIVEEDEDKDYDIDEAIVLDEFSSIMTNMPAEADMDMEEENMEQSEMNMEDSSEHMNEMDEEMSHDDEMAEMYDTMIVNGKASPQMEEIVVTEGDKVKLRFVNAGLMTKVIHIPNHDFKVTHYDGQTINEPEILSNTAIRLGAAERVDVEIEANNPGAYGVEISSDLHPKNLQAVLPLRYKGTEAQELVTEQINNYLDIAEYGTPDDMTFDEENINKEYDVSLDTEDGGDTFTINGKQMDTESAEGHEIYEVEEGDIVKMNLKNETDVDHPMHLHGSFFQVVTKNGEELSGSSVTKDTLNLRPNEEYEVVFVADNPGNWLFHCHEFHHASGGMVSEVQYKDFEPSVTIDPEAPNKPE